MLAIAEAPTVSPRDPHLSVTARNSRKAWPRDNSAYVYPKKVANIQV